MDTKASNNKRDTEDEKTKPKKASHKRRKHTNSRLGCANCKKRQIKCDETLPVCGNCSRRNEPCSYMFLSADDFQQIINLKNLKNLKNNDDDSKVKRKSDNSHRMAKLDNMVSAGLNKLAMYNLLVQNEGRENFHLENKDKVDKIKLNDRIGPTLANEYFDTLLKDKSNKIEDNKLNKSNSGMEIELENNLFKNQPFQSIVDEYMVHEPLLNQFLNSINEYLSNDEEEEEKDDDDDDDDDSGIYQIEKLRNKLKLKNDYSIKYPGFYSEKAKDKNDLNNDTSNETSTDNQKNSQYESMGLNLGINSTSDTGSDTSSDISHSSDSDPSTKPMAFGNNVPSPFKVDTPLFQPEMNNYEPLPGATLTNKSFKILPNIPKTLNYLIEQISSPVEKVSKENIQILRQKYGIVDFNELYHSSYKIYFQFLILFSKLIKKSIFLYVVDVLKNILFKQKSILKDSLTDENRIRICGVCEKISVMKLSELTKLINNDYIQTYSQCTKAKKEIMLTGFITLGLCTAYHYNSGYRQNISVEQSNQCIKFIGTFTSGMFSIMIDENKMQGNKQFQAIIRYSKAVLLREKMVIVKCINNKIVNEIYYQLYSLKLFKIDKYNEKLWASPYMNLMLFLEKHYQFLSVYKERSLLGFDKGYLIRMMNEWFQIYPYDLVNITKLKQKGKRVTRDIEIQMIIYLTYICMRYVLQATVPAIRTLLRSSFIASSDMPYDSLENLLDCYKILKNRDYKHYAIYIIRIITFLKIRSKKLESMLMKLYIPEFSSTEKLNNSERCERLLNNWKYNDIILEDMKDLFSLKEDYISKSNYPKLNTRSGEIDVVNDNKDGKVTNKIKLRTKAEIINDFETNNNGLLSLDFDPRNEESRDESVINSSTNEHDFNINAILMNCWNIENFIKLNKE
ncbi:hypothetical protein DAPK24_019540 [Pichia kluyveri]|uniref:Zn(2)-C6 fungal-type domain-containing protein n=1 Tax=Pichia kluyveri TaxID=36015 RepID=A0AAV5R410_PICKL|nr:hypothetical protein DAPK24_019540 [Pichia kluyveri]